MHKPNQHVEYFLFEHTMHRGTKYWNFTVFLAPSELYQCKSLLVYLSMYKLKKNIWVDQVESDGHIRSFDQIKSADQVRSTDQLIK